MIKNELLIVPPKVCHVRLFLVLIFAEKFSRANPNLGKNTMKYVRLSIALPVGVGQMRALFIIGAVQNCIFSKEAKVYFGDNYVAGHST